MGGIPVPAVVRFGHGFIQGAEHAARELGLAAGEVEINFAYLGNFNADPGHTIMASSWYAGGTTVIFAAAGQAGGSVMNAAESNNAFVIGVDTDQSHLSPTVITSAMKGVNESVYQMINNLNNNAWRGGTELNFTVANNGVGLPMSTSKFATFSQADYDAIFRQIGSGAVRVNDSLDMEAIRAGLNIVVVND